MSASGQGDEDVEVEKGNKDEIANTTSVNDGAQNSVTEIKHVSDSNKAEVHLESKYSMDGEMDSAIGSITMESKDIGKNSDADDDICGETTPSPVGGTIETSSQGCSNIETDLNDDKDSCSLSEDLELKWDEDEGDLDDTNLTDDVKTNQDDKLDKPTIDEDKETTDTVQTLDLGINKTGQSEEKCSDLDNIEHVEKSGGDCVIPSINNKIDEVKMASTSLESQNITNEIDVITNDNKSNTDTITSSLGESSVIIHTQTNQEMDVDTPTTEPLSKNLELTEAEQQKQVKMDVKIASEVPLEPVLSSLIEKENTKNLEEAETSILKESIKEMPVDTNVSNKKTNVESKDLVLKESTNKKEDVNEQASLPMKVTNINEIETNNSEVSVLGEIEGPPKTVNIKANVNSEKSDKDISVQDTITPITPNIHHRINKPNVMLDIPTQELSDIEAELDDDDVDYDVEKSLDDKTLDVTLEVASKTDTDSEMTELKNEVTNKSPTVAVDTSSTVGLSVNSELKPSQETPTMSDETINLVEKIDKNTTSKEVKNETVQSIREVSENPTEINESEKPKLTEEEPKLTGEKVMLTEEKLKLTEELPKMDVDEEPSTSKAQATLEIPPDTDDDQEVSDSLGLLAESSRVMDDDNDDDGDDAEDQEVDDNDDEDFDPYEENNSEMTEDMDDSTTPPPEPHKQHKPGDKLLGQTFDGHIEAQDNTVDIVDDMECDENDLDLQLPGDTISDATKNQQEMSDDAEINKGDKSPENIINILEKVLGPTSTEEKKNVTTATVNVRNYVEVEGSSDSEDVQEVSKTPDLSVDSEDVTESGISLGTPKTPTKVSKINTDEVTIKTANPALSPLQVVESNFDTKPKCDEIFNLDSDDDDAANKDATVQEEATEPVENKSESKEYKSCEVPECTNTSIKTPDKIFIDVPKNIETRRTWFELARKDCEQIKATTNIFFCEDHFNVKQDMENYHQYKIGLSQRIVMVNKVLPSKFSCQEECNKLIGTGNTGPAQECENSSQEPIMAPKEESPKTENKCINPSCTSETQTYYPVDRTIAAYYSLTRRIALVCDPCRQRANERSEALINGIKDLRPLLELDMDAPSQQLVEISDSDSDGEHGDDTDRVGEKEASFLEDNLADLINETWNKYKMQSRLKETETFFLNELDKIEADAKEIDAMLDECQKKTDAIRFDFYKNYELKRKSLGSIIIHDTPFSCYSHAEKDLEQPFETTGSRYPKRRAASVTSDTPAKKQTIPLEYSPLDADKMMETSETKTEDDKEDISVVKLSAESAPADLPPPGDIVRPPLKAGMTIYAMRNAFGTWLKGKIVDVQPKAAGQQFSQCRVKFEHKVKNACKILAGRCLAYPDPSPVRMTIGTRVVALFKDPQNQGRRESFYSGVIAEIPNPVNSYRYLVFFDDGYAQYVHHRDTRVVCESSNLVWEEVHQFIRDFIYKYLLAYPERPMVRLHAGEKLKTEWNGKWWDSKVLKVDASIALISFDEDNRTEWIYRGSTRLAPLYLELQAARAGGKRLPRNKAHVRSNMPCVEYTRSDEQPAPRTAETQQQNEELRRQRAVAKKSTTLTAPPSVAPGTNYEGVISRVVYYTPKNAVKPHKMVAHTCTVHCRRLDLLSMKDLRTYNPLAKPLLSGWERQTVRFKGHRAVVYRAPCGRRLRNMPELHRYLRLLQSDMSVDLFDFTPGTHCLAEFVLSKCNVSKKDLSHGKENVPVPCVNYYDNSLPEFCSYNTERTPTAGVPLNLDPDFLCGCDCTDDCTDKSKCACWKMTLEGARTIGLEGQNVGYVYRRLPEPLPSGIYECNSRCKCKQTCLNRVAQHPLQLKLQVFKTINRGWGIRALNDVPKGSFLCVYAGNLLTDATANLDGLNEGDEYLAELDYIEVVEAMKEGYEEDVPDEDKKLDKKGSDSEPEPSSESEEEKDQTKEDGDFQPGYIGQPNLEFKKRLRKREKAKIKEEKEKEEAIKEKREDCITISDDDEVREPSRFTAEACMVDKDLITKQSSRVSVRTLFGKDEACYIMDAKVQGNIGRYLNHSCHPNVFVQNVFVDTHDPRFPWVAFFALSHVRAGTELTWNYNYDVGSVPEKVLYCYCGAANCRGRLL